MAAAHSRKRRFDRTAILYQHALFVLYHAAKIEAECPEKSPEEAFAVASAMFFQGLLFARRVEAKVAAKRRRTEVAP